MEPEFESQLAHEIIGRCSREYELKEDILSCAVQRAKGVSVVETVPMDIPRNSLDTLSRDALEEIRDRFLR